MCALTPWAATTARIHVGDDFAVSHGAVCIPLSALVTGAKPHRLLDEVDIISTVSGGSFTAAYYARCWPKSRVCHGNFPAALR